MNATTSAEGSSASPMTILSQGADTAQVAGGMADVSAAAAVMDAFERANRRGMKGHVQRFAAMKRAAEAMLPIARRTAVLEKISITV